MTAGVFFAVLFAAALHAGWNALIKTGLSKQSSMMVLSVGHALVAVPILLQYPMPPGHVWPWIIGSGLIHMAYQTFLAYAYEQGDLSRVYPIARGAAPMIVALVMVFGLHERLTPMEGAGLLLLGLGIALMARGVFTNGESRKLLPFAFGSAMATAGYTLADGLGARAWGLPLAYISWVMVFSALFYVPLAVALKGRGVLRLTPKGWAQGLIASVASFAAYAIAVWAMTQAPISLVAALRETSILFAMLLGALIFRDKLDTPKLIAGCLIVAGVILTRL